MKKFADMTMNELSQCLCEIAGPAENLFSDRAVIDAMEDMRSRMPEKTTVETAFSLFTMTLLPILTGEAHKADVYRILGALTGCTAAETEARNGLEVMRDLFVVFVSDRDVEAIFRPGCQVRG